MNDTRLSRNIPTEVRRTLRQEVNYGCPVESCGSPYLSYHHFDPPWHDKNHHNPNGMIALCLHHHKAADNGAYKTEQLKKLKTKPFLSNDDLLIGQISWKKDNILFDVGSNYFIGASEIYLRKDEKLIWLEFDNNGNLMINIDIKDKAGNLIFSMRNNDWVVSTSLQDIESPPAMKMIKLQDIRRNIKLSIDFKIYTKENFSNEFQKNINNQNMSLILSLLPEKEIVICKVRGLLQYPFHIHFKDGSTDMKNVIGPFTINNIIQIDENSTIAKFELINNFNIGNGILIK